ncbi:hypothetical protein FOE67_15460, partial [Streptomyces calidiresistens]|nr:hypothetical protein [Streptomyces calidiresistens]
MNDRQAPAGYPPAGSTDDTAPSPYGYGYPQETGYTHHPGDGIAEGSGGGYGTDPYGQATAYDNGRHSATSWDNTPAHGMPRFREFTDASGAGHEGWGAQGGWDAGGSDHWGGESTAPAGGDGYGTGWDGQPGDRHGGWDNGWDGTADTTGSPAAQPAPGEWDPRTTGAESSEGWGTAGGWDTANGTGHHGTDGYGTTGHESGYDSGYDDPYGVAGGHREADGERWAPEAADTDTAYDEYPEHSDRADHAGRTAAEYPERIPGDEPDDSPGPDTMAFRAITRRLADEDTGAEGSEADHRPGYGDDDPEGPGAGPRRSRRRSPK